MYLFAMSKWGITKKMRLMILIIAIAILGIIVVNSILYIHIEGMLGNIVDNNVAQIVDNARFTREFSKVLAETNILIHTFIERKETLKIDSNNLLATLQRNISGFKFKQEKSLEALHGFEQRLQSLLGQCMVINGILDGMQVTNDKLDTVLGRLDEIVATKRIAVTTEGTDEEISAAEQLSNMLSVFRELQYLVNIHSARSIRAHLGTKIVIEDGERQIQSFLAEFEVGLFAVPIIWENIQPFVEQLKENVFQYKKHIKTLHKGMQEFQKRWAALESSQKLVLHLMEDIDGQIARSTGSIHKTITNNLASSGMITIVLSFAIVFLLIIIGNFTVKMVRPLERLSETASHIAEGDIYCDFNEVKSHDEIGALSHSFKRLITYIQDMADAAIKISKGELSLNTRPKSERDVLGNAFQNMSGYLKEIEAAAISIAGGDLSIDIQSKTQIGLAFNKMVHNLRESRDHLEELVKERTRELEKAQAELVKKERLAALGHLTATVSHELRNPLGTVSTSIFSIGDSIKRNEFERVDRALKLAERNIQRCDGIITELLDFTRKRELKPKPIDIDTWLSDLLDEQEIPEGIECKRDFRSGLLIPIDREYLRRAVINVVTNAVQALQEEESTGNRLMVESKVAGDRLEIRISDTGPGMSADVLDKLFEPLFSTKGFGVGLGLPIVKDIMAEHGGGIEIQSEIGKSTIVLLWLPLESNKS